MAKVLPIRTSSGDRWEVPSEIDLMANKYFQECEAHKPLLRRATYTIIYADTVTTRKYVFL